VKCLYCGNKQMTKGELVTHYITENGDDYNCVQYANPREPGEYVIAWKCGECGFIQLRGTYYDNK